MVGQIRDKSISDSAGEDVDTIDFEIIELLFFAYRDFTGDRTPFSRRADSAARIIASCISSTANPA